MGGRWTRVAALAATVAATGCIEGEMNVLLRKDGTGTCSWNNRPSTKSVEAIRAFEKECREAAAPGEEFKFPVDALEPDAKAKAAMREAGLEVKEWVTRCDEKEISNRGRVEFERFSSLTAMKLLRTSRYQYDLTRDAEGVYEIAVRKDPAAVPATDNPLLQLLSDPRYSGPGARLLQAAQADMSSLKSVFTFAVPGEVVDFEVLGGSERNGPSSVRIDLSMKSILDAVARLAAEGKKYRTGDPIFRIRFRMPEGESIPDSRLSARPAEKAVPAKEPGPPAGPAEKDGGK